jgi:hypothetical protein
MATFGPNCMLRMLHFNLLSRYGDQLCAGHRDVTQHEKRSEPSSRPNMPGLCNSNNTISISKPCFKALRIVHDGLSIQRLPMNSAARVAPFKPR